MNCRGSLVRDDLDQLFEPFTRGFLFFVFAFLKFFSHFIIKKFNSTENSPDLSGSSGVFYISSLTTYRVSVRATWELPRNAESRAHPGSTELESAFHQIDSR